MDYAILSAKRSNVKIKSLKCRIVLMQSVNLGTPSTMTKKLQKEEEKGKSKKGLGEQREQKRMEWKVLVTILGQGAQSNSHILM